MFGFFSSELLASLAPGLASFIASSSDSLKIVVSPYLTEQDRQAIEEGTRSVDEVAASSLEDLLITEDLLESHTLRCLSYLLRVGRLQIKVAVMQNALFHMKVWIFGDDGDLLVASGSGNGTKAGIKKNKEQITVSKSWSDDDQREICDRLDRLFENLWRGDEEDTAVIDLPIAVEQEILQRYPTESPPTEQEFRDLYKRVRGLTDQDQQEFVPPEIPTNEFRVPDWLVIYEGPYSHQGQAVSAWCENGFQGVLEMATGSGKTITAMVCAHRLHQELEKLFVVVAAPYIPLVEQWCDEVALFGVRPQNLTMAGSARKRARSLNGLARRVRTGTSNIEVVVVSHDTLCTDEFHEAVKKIDCPRMLIADEAHNLGRPQFINDPPDYFEYRLALSATPVRQYDQEGTAVIFDFFSNVVFRFGLDEAIGRCLVEYDYFLHPVHLSEDEMERWHAVTEKIRENAWRQDESGPDEYLAKLYRDRRLILETAEKKVETLAGLLDDEPIDTLRYTLVYATDKEPKQLEQVNALLRERGIPFHQLTANETAQREQMKSVIGTFQSGDIRVLTAKRVLDEGVNIPQISKAFVLASTTVERQWVQRRGRLLRTCKEIGKTHSVIHDLIALPPSLEELDRDARSLIKSELARAQEFAMLARNAGRDDGPLPVLKKLTEAAYL